MIPGAATDCRKTDPDPNRGLEDYPEPTEAELAAQAAFELGWDAAWEAAWDRAAAEEQDREAHQRP